MGTVPLPRFLASALAGALCLVLTGVLAQGDHSALAEFADAWALTIVFVLVAVTLGWRTTKIPGERLALGILTAGMTLYAGGNIVFQLFLQGRPEIPFPSVADWMWLGLQLSGVVGLALLGRARGMSLNAANVLDGFVVGLVLAALCAVGVYEFVYADVVAKGYTFGLVFPLLDLLVIAALIVATAARGWRPERATLIFIAGFTCVAFADSVYVVQAATDGWATGTWLDLPYAIGTVLIGLAAWTPAPRARQVATDTLRAQVVPLVAGVLGVLLTAVTVLADLNPVAELSAVALVTLVAVRLGLLLRDFRALTAASRHEARTDSLTGLPNRRSLMDDLEARGTEPCVLALFDLDGFKAFNDTHGHGAGDVLLVRLARRLVTALTDGATAYRMGGDEFCVVAPLDAEAHVRSAAPAALSLIVDALPISCSWGVVRLGEDAFSACDALRIADQRMYAMKNGRPRSAGSQLREVLVRVLDTREPELHDHVLDVGRLASATARRLGLGEHEITDVLHGAELHDVGKLAIPEAILHKPGPLDDEEWEVMRRHTIIGEQFLSGIPALATASRLVRSSHERWDGKGYPDALAGEEIPIGARIIAVCDAYDAIVTDRPYRKGASKDDALVELHACAGTQFDPAVVKAFTEVVSARRRSAPAAVRALV
jgi:diguanylate cyclase (GGDEF)-like protein